METLLTGHLDSVSQSFLTHLSMKTDVIISTEDDTLHFSGKNITPYYQSVLDDEFLHFFASYSFDAVIYFSSSSLGFESDSHDLEKLNRLLEACAQRQVKKVIVISSNYQTSLYKEYSGDAVDAEQKAPGTRIFSLEELCRTYRETYHIPVLILRTPFLFGEEETSSFVGKSIKQVIEKGEVVMDGKAEQLVEFLSVTDLGRLIERLLLEDSNSIALMTIPGATVLSLRQFAALILQKQAAADIRFTEKEWAVAPPVAASMPSRIYSWEPTINLKEELPSIIERMEEKYTPKTKTLWEKVHEFYTSHAAVLAGLELVIGYLIMEYLVIFSGTMVQFRVVDFRLLFVVLFASVHGPRIGLAAAFMASVSLYRGFVASGINWLILLYNVDNWIPFASYFIVAWIIGYSLDRYRMDATDAKEDVEDLSQRHSLLNDLYMRLLERKSLYEKQIISYDDSFGRLYTFAVRLEDSDSSLYFVNALDALEEILANQTIGIYVSKNKTLKAYRYKTSLKAEKLSPEVLDITEHDEFEKTMRTSEVWTNRNALKGCPDYALRVYTSTNFNVFITVHHASFDQMSLYYENLIKVTGHFISTTMQQKTAGRDKILEAELLEFIRKVEDDYDVREKQRLPGKYQPLHIVPQKSIAGNKGEE